MVSLEDFDRYVEEHDVQPGQDGVAFGLTFHYIDTYRREGRSIRTRQHEIEAYAERTNELV